MFRVNDGIGKSAVSLWTPRGHPDRPSAKIWAQSEHEEPSCFGTSFLVLKVLTLSHALKCYLKNTQSNQDEIQGACSVCLSKHILQVSRDSSKRHQRYRHLKSRFDLNSAVQRCHRSSIVPNSFKYILRTREPILMRFETSLVKD